MQNCLPVTFRGQVTRKQFCTNGLSYRARLAPQFTPNPSSTPYVLTLCGLPPPQLRAVPPGPRSLWRVGFASQITQSFHTKRSALQPEPQSFGVQAGVTPLSLPRASFILVGVFGGLLSLPLTTPLPTRQACAWQPVRPLGQGTPPQKKCSIPGWALKVTTLFWWQPAPFSNSPLPSPLPSILHVPALPVLPGPCVMPASNPIRPPRGAPQCPLYIGTVLPFHVRH